MVEKHFLHTQLCTSATLSRRSIVLTPILGLCTSVSAVDMASGSAKQWIKAAEEMKQHALSWGDQAYGAVLVKGNRIIGYGPSRVVKNNDLDAHAEREAIKDALAKQNPEELMGSVLYSTSRPCNLCEAAAARAGVARMYFGAEANDAGKPKAGS